MAHIERSQRMFGAMLHHVYLTDDEYAIAEEGGGRRYQNAVERGLRDYLREPSKKNHIVGAVGEVAVRLLLRKPVVVNSLEFNVADIAPDIQVRCSRSYLPKVKDTDDPEWIIVGCRWWEQKRNGKPCVTVWGGIRASTARAEIRQTDPGGRGRPAHFLHWTDFRDIQPLIDREAKNEDREIQNPDRQADGDVSTEALDSIARGSLF